MENFIYLFGLAHIIAYCVVGSVAGITWLMAWSAFKFANHRRFLKTMIEWRIAKSRWDHRHIDGLSDAEWQRGEPNPTTPPTEPAVNTPAGAGNSPVGREG